MADLATLQARLADAELAEHKLITGSQRVSVGFGAGKTVTYTQATLADLRAYITRLKEEIAALTGASTPAKRGPIRFTFGC
jgi:hypothetical protein